MREKRRATATKARCQAECCEPAQPQSKGPTKRGGPPPSRIPRPLPSRPPRESSAESRDSSESAEYSDSRAEGYSESDTFSGPVRPRGCEPPRSTSRGRSHSRREGRRKRQQSPSPSSDSGSWVPPRRKRRRPVTSSSEMDSTASDSDSYDSVLAKQSSRLKGSKGRSKSTHNVPICTQISSKLRRKIVNHKYVDFSKLLPVTFEQNNPDDFDINVNRGKGGSSINILPAKKQKKVTNIHSWTTAFMRYAAIYCQHHPMEAPAILKYGEVVRELADEYAYNAWQAYDFNFRTLREQIRIPWDQIHNEFWVRATTKRAQSQQPFRQNRRAGYASRQGGRKPRSREFLPNTCYAYNRRGFCSQVRCYPHVCGYCLGQHSAKSCSKQTPNTSQQATSARPPINRAK